MLQFNKHLFNITSKLTSWRCATALGKFSTISSIPTKVDPETNTTVKQTVKKHKPTEAPNHTQSLSNITPEQSIDSLLNSACDPEMTAEKGKQILSIITNKISSGEARVHDIFKDKRFLKLQAIILDHGSTTKPRAAKPPVLPNFNAYSLGELVTALKQLALQKKRNMSLLIPLITEIADEDKHLSVRQCSDVLYSMAALSFHNEIMLQKIVDTLLSLAPGINDGRTIASLLTSIGMLRYKHPKLLAALYDKSVFLNPNLLASAVSAIQTAATLNYKSEFVHIFAKNLSDLYLEHDMPNYDMWIDFVWSLLILKMTTHKQISSVLGAAIHTLAGLSNPKKLKILNINSAAIADPFYTSHVLNEEQIAHLDVKLGRSVQQQHRVHSLESVLKAIMPSEEYFATNINTYMGFYLDAECHYDLNGNPVELATDNVQDPNIKRVGIILHSYTDHCLGACRELIGPVKLQIRLLKSKNYTVVSLPYEEYRTDDTAENQQKLLRVHIQEALKQ